MLKLWQNDDWRAKNIASRIKKWQEPECRKHHVEAMIKVWQNPAHRQHISESMKQKWKDPNYRKKIIPILLRVNHLGMQGHPMSLMTREVKRENMRLHWADPEWRENQIRFMHKKDRRVLKGHSQTQDTRKRISQTMKGRKPTEQHSAKVSIALKELWKNPTFAKEQHRKTHSKPTKPELKLEALLNCVVPTEYKYVGNGDFVLGGKNPDFLNVNGQKKIIELFGRPFHDASWGLRKKIPWHQTEQGCTEFYRQYGFETLVVWDNELSDVDTLANRILMFNGGNSP